MDTQKVWVGLRVDSCLDMPVIVRIFRDETVAKDWVNGAGRLAYFPPPYLEEHSLE